MAAVADPKAVSVDVKEGAKKSAAKAVKKKFIVFVNPKFTKLNKPCFVAILVFLFTLILWGVLFNDMISSCYTDSFTTLSRAELIQFIEAPPTGYFASLTNKKRNMNCVRYIAKLMTVPGEVTVDMDVAKRKANDPDSTSMETPECTYYGKNWSKEKSGYLAGPGEMGDATDFINNHHRNPGNEWADATDREGKYTCQRKASWLPRPGLIRYMKCAPGNLQYDPTTGTTAWNGQEAPSGRPEGEELKADFVWVNAETVKKMRIAGVPQVAGGHGLANSDLEDAMTNWGNAGPMGEFITAGQDGKPDKTMQEAGTLSPSQIESLLMGGSSDDVRVRFNGSKEKFLEFQPSEATDAQKEEAWQVRRGELQYYEFKLYDMPAMDYSLWEPDTIVQSRSRWLEPDMLCEEEGMSKTDIYIRDYVEGMNRGADCSEGGYYYNEHGGSMSAMLKDQRCTNVRLCDKTGPKGAPAQTQYGNFIVAYDRCPDFVTTVGVSFGFTGQIEGVITIILLSVLMCSGTVTVKTDSDADMPKGWRERIKANFAAASEVAEDPDQIGDDIAQLQKKHAELLEKQKQEAEAKQAPKLEGEPKAKPSTAEQAS